jgi:uncharacterized protein (TIGR03437 family)
VLRLLVAVAFMAAADLAFSGVAFEPNVGQAHASVQWIARSGSAVPMYLGAGRTAIMPAGLGSHPVVMRLTGSDSRVRGSGEQKLESYSNYFLGRDEKTWFSGVPHYAAVRYRDIYPGIDLVYHAKGNDVEYDFEVRPGGDSSRIEISFDHADRIRVDRNGDLLIHAGGRDLRQRRPKVFQEGREIDAAYRMKGKDRVQMAIASFDRGRPLLIDPVVEFSTYLGGPSGENGSALYVDEAGFIYIAGSSGSPVTPGLDPFQQTGIAVGSPYLFKFSPDGKRLVFYAALAVDAFSNSNGITVDRAGNLLWVGATSARQFPLRNAAQSEFRSRVETAFATKLSPDGKTILYSTYFGGSGDETPNAGAVADAAGNLYFGGVTSSRDFPVSNAMQPAFLGGNTDGFNLGLVLPPLHCFVTKLSPEGKVVFSTYLESSKLDYCKQMTMAPDGDIVIAGYTNGSDFPTVAAMQTAPASTVPFPLTFGTRPFLAKLQPDGQAFTFSTYLGGNIFGTSDAVAVDSTGNIFLAGSVIGGVLSTKSAFQDRSPVAGSAFVMKLDPAAKNILYATYLGGSGQSFVADIAAGSDGSAYVSGGTLSPDFPLANSLQAFQGPLPDRPDFFLTRIAPTGSSLLFSTYLGGNDREVGGRLYLRPPSVYFLGTTWSTNVPTKAAYQPKFGGVTDILLMKLTDDLQAPVPVFTLGAGSVALRFVQGGPAPDAQTITVAGPAFTVRADAAWLTVNSATGETGARTLKVGVSTQGLTPGTYQGTVIIRADVGDGAAVIQVTLTVIGAAPRLDSVTPNEVPPGSDDTELVFRGGPFTSSTTLLLQTIPWTLTPLRIENENTLRITVPKPYFQSTPLLSFTVQNPQSAVSNAVLVFIRTPAATLRISAVANAAGYGTGPHAPGEIVVLAGTGFASPGTSASLTLDTAGKVATTLAGAQVLFNDVPAPLIYVGSTQINAIVPYETAGLTSATVVVKLQSNASSAFPISMTSANPALFTANSSGSGQGAILNQDSVPNAAGTPAAPGSVVTLYLTGEGQTSPGGVTGKITTISPAPPITPKPVLTVEVFIGDQPANILFSGEAPDAVSGLLQLNVEIPKEAPSGNLPVRVVIGGKSSPAGVTVSVK